jgi:hypothetical protein
MVVKALAVAGFVALVALSMWLAVYATRFVPSMVNRVGSATAYLGSVFMRAPASSPVTTTATSTVPEAIQLDGENPATSPAPAKREPVATSAGAASRATYQIGTSTSQGTALSGLPDLITTIDAVGYLTSTSTDSFVASSTVPSGSRVAVRFTIKNVGTNTAGVWRFSASIPTQTAYIYQSQLQQTLAPGDRIEYTLGFDQATPGADKTISITANFDRTVAESNPDNNSDAAKITILGN